MSAGALKNILSEVGRRIGNQNASAASEEDIDTLLDKTMHALEELGGAAQVIREEKKILIKSESCPFADAVKEHAEVCKLVESMVEEIVGQPVKEICDRQSLPQCCFEINVA